MMQRQRVNAAAIKYLDQRPLGIQVSLSSASRYSTNTGLSILLASPLLAETGSHSVPRTLLAVLQRWYTFTT